MDGGGSIEGAGSYMSLSKLAISKKSIFFVLPLWNMVKIITSWGISFENPLKFGMVKYLIKSVAALLMYIFIQINFIYVMLF